MSLGRSDLPVAIDARGVGRVYRTGRTSVRPAQAVLALFVTGGVSTLVAGIIFRVSARRASALGLFDRTTGS
jgi:hypothetical protein